MTLEQFFTHLNANPEKIQFSDTMAAIDTNYGFTPSKLTNDANQNNDSCKLLAFAKLHQLDADHTLHCFGDFYRKDVLGHPNNTDHQNIRNLIENGLDGVQFESFPLIAKTKPE